jgi:hypothetical protein
VREPAGSAHLSGTPHDGQRGRSGAPATCPRGSR